MLLRTAITVSLVALIALVIGLIFGAVAGWASFSGAVLLLLFHHVAHLESLVRWLKRPTPGEVPEGRGAWDRVFALLHRFERTHVKQHQQLAKTLARFRQAGRAHPDGVVILDADNRIEWCNDTAEAHFDLSAGTDAGQPVTNLVR